MLSQKAQKDLCKLALARAEKAVRSVGQLMETDEQLIHMLVLVAAAAIDNAADIMLEGARKRGNDFDKQGAFCEIVKMIVDAAGIECRIDEQIIEREQANE